MTNREVDFIHYTAYKAWLSLDSTKDLLKLNKSDQYLCYEVVGSDKAEYITVVSEKLMTASLLNDYGFPESTKVKLLFTVNCAEETLI